MCKLRRGLAGIWSGPRLHCPGMTTPARSTAGGLAARQGVFATLGVLCGLFITDFWPVIGMGLGVVALVGAVAHAALKRTPPWFGWLTSGFVVGVCLFLILLAVRLSNPVTGGGSG